jgi:hypothetical protein
MATGVLRIAAFGRYGFTGSGGTSRTGLAGHLVRPGVGPGATYPRHIGTVAEDALALGGAVLPVRQERLC